MVHSPNVHSLTEISRMVDMETLHSVSERALGSVTESVGKGKNHQRDPNAIFAKYLIPVEDSLEAVGSVIKMILISKISMCSL